MKNEEKNFWDKFLPKLFIFTGGFILGLVIFIFASTRSQASAGQTYFPMQQNGNNIYTDRDITVIENFVNANSNYYFCWVKSIASGNHQYYFVSFPKSSLGGIIGELNVNGYQFTLKKAGPTTNYTYGYIDVKTQSTYHGYYVSYTGNDPTVYIQGAKNSSLYSTSVSYLSNFSLYTSLTKPKKYVLIYGDYIALPENGDPSAFDDSGLTIDSSLNPNTVPTVPGSYSVTIPTAPTWDSSAPVQSIFDYLIWGFSVLNTLLQGVISKISEWIAFVGQLIGYLVQKILDYIKAVVQWLYLQFLDWLTPYLKILTFIYKFLFDESTQLSVLDILNAILDSIDNLFAGTFFEDIWDWFDDNYVTPSLTNLYNIVDAIDKIRILFTTDSQPIYLRGVFFDSYMGQFLTQGRRLGVGLLEIFQNIQTPDSLIFAVDFGELPLGHYFRDVGIIYIDFSWYAGIRTLIQTLFVTCLYVGVGFTLFFKIPNIINGSQGLDSMFGVTYTTTPYEGNDMVYRGQARIGGPVAKGGKH